MMVSIREQVAGSTATFRAVDAHGFGFMDITLPSRPFAACQQRGRNRHFESMTLPLHELHDCNRQCPP